MSGKWIMIVDDEPAMLELLKLHLEGAGFFVTTAPDAEQALIQAETLKPALMIIDMMMPVFGTGADLYAKIRAHPNLAETPIIVLTAMQPDKARAMLPVGARLRILTKPVDLPHLRKTIRDVVVEGY